MSPDGTQTRNRHRVGDRRGLHGVPHAGRLRNARSRFLAWQERRRRRREDPRQPLDRHGRVLGHRLRPGVRQRQRGVRHGRLLPQRLDFSSLSFSVVPLSAKFLFEVVFCTVSLAIVWGTMLDRTKFGVYIVFAVVFAGLIYPLVGHWIWGGGFLADLGMQDFAGSTVVHLCGATAALAGTLVLGARIGKFDAQGQGAPDPGPLDAARHPRRADPLVRLVRLQPGLDPGSRRRALRRHRRDDQPRCRCRRARRDHRRLHRSGARSTSASPATARSPASSRSRRPAPTSTSGRPA